MTSPGSNAAARPSTQSRRSSGRAAAPTGISSTSPTQKRSGQQSRAALKESGKIDVVIHAAGLEISHFLPDKEPQTEYDLVFDVKSSRLAQPAGTRFGGHAARRPPWRSARSPGRLRQRRPDRLLRPPTTCCASSASQHPHDAARTRVASRSTGRRGRGIGMASRGSIPKMMEVAGIDMLPAEVGGPGRPPRADGDWAPAARSSMAGALGICSKLSVTPPVGSTPSG